MTYIANIVIDQNNNCFLLKNNVEYLWAKFIQASKIPKKLISIFFNNLNSPMQQHLSYKNINKMKLLLTKLIYGKIIC